MGTRVATVVIGASIGALVIGVTGFLLGKTTGADFTGGPAATGQRPHLENLTPDPRLVDAGLAQTPTLMASSGRGPGAVTWGATVTVITPAKDLPDKGGVASGWKFNPEAVNAQVTLGALAKELSPSGAQPQCYENSPCHVSNTSGDFFSLGNDPRRILTGFLRTRSPGCPGTDGSPEACASENADISDAQAQEQARRFMESLGANPETYTWTVEHRSPGSVKVYAQLTLSGYVLPYQWDFDVSDQGVYSISAFLAPLEEIPGYQIVGAASAVQRTSDIAWRGTGPVPLWKAQDVAKPYGDAVSSFDQLLAKAQPATALEPAKVDGKPTAAGGTTALTATRAQLGLGTYRSAVGEPLILPAWIVNTNDEQQWSVLAVDAKYLVN